jgi:quinol monooxygenase YgiN
MNSRTIFLLGASVLAAPLLSDGASAQDGRGPYVRVAEMEIDPAHLDRFNAAAKEEIEASIRVEPGVLALYAVAMKDNPAHVRVFEMYKDAAAYASHLQTPHFQKLKAETQDIVKALRLFDAIPIVLGSKPKD